MAHRPAIHFGAGFAPRGLDLAERRLAYLVELYDSGRWRRFHGDADFLAMVREAKAAIDTWRRLLPADPIEVEPSATLPLVAADGAALTPPLPGGAPVQDQSPTISAPEERAAPLHWLRRGDRLPPVLFSNHGVVAKGDLAEA